MTTKVQKWGHSLAVRIPRALAGQMHLGPNSTVELHVEEGRLVLTPQERPRYTLAMLLAGVTNENRHQVSLEDSPVGEEAW
jgi:antitoxin MazE